ncbi:MAG: hypothetical protein ACYCZ0_00845 [Minisyncoccota bacterium]
MIEEPSLTGGIFWAMRFFTDIAFRWIPGTVQVVAGTAPQAGDTPPPIRAITEPITTTDVAHFLQTSASADAYNNLYQYWTLWIAIIVIGGLLLSASIIYCALRIMQVRRHEHDMWHAAAHTVAAQDVPKTQLRWNRVLEQVHSENEQGWRLAILEADIMLNELLDVLGHRGETMADKMKQIDRSRFHTVDLAWEAHSVRNQIAHQGSMKSLDSREARRIVSLYEKVFKEFDFVS